MKVHRSFWAVVLFSLLALGLRLWNLGSVGLVGTEVETGIQFVVGVWEHPPGVKDYEHPVEDIATRVAFAFEEWNVWRMYADPPGWDSEIASWAGRWGAERVVLFLTNRHSKMAVAVRAFNDAITSGELRNDGNSVYAKHIGHG